MVAAPRLAVLDHGGGVAAVSPDAGEVTKTPNGALPCSAPQVAGKRKIAASVGGESNPCCDDLAVGLERHPVRLVLIPEVRCLLSVAAEARVECSIGVVTDERKVTKMPVATIWLRRGARADCDDLAVALDRNPARKVSAPEVGRLLSVTGKARVQRSVRVVAGKRELEVGTAGRTGGHDLAVSLKRHPVGEVAVPREKVRRLLSVAGEGRIKGAVGVEAGDREVGVPGEADADDLVVALDGHPAGLRVAPEADGLNAVAGEARVERTARIEAGDHEAGAAQPDAASASGHDDLAVCLERHGICLAGAHVGGLLSVVGEGWVERAVWVVASDRKTTTAAAAHGDDLAVRLSHHALGAVLSAKVGGLLAIVGEGGVEGAVGVVAGERKAAAGGACGNDLAVVLDRHSVGPVGAPEIGRLFAVAGERQVEVPRGGYGHRGQDKADYQGGDDATLQRLPSPGQMRKKASMHGNRRGATRRRPSASAGPLGRVDKVRRSAQVQGQASHAAWRESRSDKGLTQTQEQRRSASRVKARAMAGGLW